MYAYALKTVKKLILPRLAKILDNGCYDVRYADGALTTTGDILLVLRQQV